MDGSFRHCFEDPILLELGMFDKSINQFKAHVQNKIEEFRYERRSRRFSTDIDISEAALRFTNRNDMHRFMCHYYKFNAPGYLREHRKYFQSDGRGFGESAFHAMWYLLLRKYRPSRCLEIGVYRGQVISLWSLLAKNLGYESAITGISPFSDAGDEVSIYDSTINYRLDTLHNFAHFELSPPVLLEAYSTDKAARVAIREGKWDLIYIDGNHDYDVALHDYLICRDSLKSGGLLVMDDSSLFTDFKPPSFSFSGHPGPSSVVKEFALKELEFVCGVGHNNVFLKSD